MPRDFPTFFRTHQVILAPLAGVSDKIMRSLCIEQGAQLTYSEMISAKGLSYDNRRSLSMLELAENEQLIVVQLFGHEPDVMAREAAAIEELLGGRLAYVDVNMGCPVRKVVSKGEGSALMDNPSVAAAIIKGIAGAVTCGVTAKIRRGVRSGEETCVEFAKVLEDAGVGAIAVHGRFAKQYYSGQSCREAVARVKEAVSVPVIGNGDISCGADAVGMMRETSCDAVMVGRAALGNPWVFAEIRAALQGDGYVRPSLAERMQAATRHASLVCGTGDKAALRMRKHAMCYLAGVRNAARFREQIDSCETLEDFTRVFSDVAYRG